MKKRLNWFKVVALVLLVAEIAIAFKVDKAVAKENIMAWRLYVAMIMFIPINVMIICTKRKVVK